MNDAQQKQRTHQHSTQYGNGTGAQTVFFLEPEPRQVLGVYVGGARKSEAAAGGTADYIVSGNKVTFAVAPVAGTRNVVFDILSA